MRFVSTAQVIAMRHNSGTVIGAASARAAAELVRRHGSGAVPTEAVDTIVEKFHDWLVLAVDAATAGSSSGHDDRDEDEDEGC
jgi:hypothetical protein